MGHYSSQVFPKTTNFSITSFSIVALANVEFNVFDQNILITSALVSTNACINAIEPVRIYGITMNAHKQNQ